MISRIISIFLVFLSFGQGGLDILADKTSLGGSLYLVNRTYGLTQMYQPDDLVKPDVKLLYSNITLRKEAAEAAEALFLAAGQEENLILVAVSGYRSYEKQRTLYSRKLNSTGSVERTNLLVAPPGASEHQLGLAMDVGRQSTTQLNRSFGNSLEGKWLAENAHRFGFIIRYKEGWTDITGYASEPWHIRYVGTDHAGEIRRLDVPLETYVRKLNERLFGEFSAEVARAHE